MGCRCLRQSEGVFLPVLHGYESKACSLLLFLAPANDLELKENLIDDIKSSQTYDLCSHIVSF